MIVTLNNSKVQKMSDLIQQQFENVNVRFVEDPTGKYAFGIVAKDLAIILEYTRTDSLTSIVKDKYKSTMRLKTEGGQSVDMTVIWEPGMYEALGKCTLPKAEVFQDWTYEEVLPSIRKTGKYEIKKVEEEIPSWAKALLVTQELKDELISTQKELIFEKDVTIKALTGVVEEKERKIFKLESIVEEYREDEMKTNEVYLDFPGLECAIEYAKTYSGVETFICLNDFLQQQGKTFVDRGERIQIGQLVSAFIKLAKLEQPIKNNGKTLYSSKFFPLLKLAIKFIRPFE